MAGLWFPLGTLVFNTNKTDCHDITEILLKVVLNTINQGFQSGPVTGTFTRLRSCIVPVEITEPPKLAVVKTTTGTSTVVDRLVEYFS